MTEPHNATNFSQPHFLRSLPLVSLFTDTLRTPHLYQWLCLIRPFHLEYPIHNTPDYAYMGFMNAVKDLNLRSLALDLFERDPTDLISTVVQMVPETEGVIHELVIFGDERYVNLNLVDDDELQNNGVIYHDKLQDYQYWDS